MEFYHLLGQREESLPANCQLPGLSAVACFPTLKSAGRPRGALSPGVWNGQMPRNLLPPGHVSAVDKRGEQEQVRHRGSSFDLGALPELASSSWGKWLLLLATLNPHQAACGFLSKSRPKFQDNALETCRTSNQLPRQDALFPCQHDQNPTPSPSCKLAGKHGVGRPAHHLLPKLQQPTQTPPRSFAAAERTARLPCPPALPPPPSLTLHMPERPFRSASRPGLPPSS